MTDLTIVVAVYGQPLMLAKQVDTLMHYAEEVRRCLNLVVVDDCGFPPVGMDELIHLSRIIKSVKLFRVTKDIHWNQMGARNLGMQHSEGWCLMIDPDMVFSQPTMARMIQAAEKMQRGQVAKYGLVHKTTGKLDMSSPNTYLIHRDDFFAVGGYDEDFAGNKGWSDVQLLDILRSTYKLILRPDLHADFYSNADVPDAAVTSLDRSTKVNKAKRVKKVGQAKAAGGWARWAKARAKTAERLRFPWEQVFPKT